MVVSHICHLHANNECLHREMLRCGVDMVLADDLFKTYNFMAHYIVICIVNPPKYQ